MPFSTTTLSHQFLSADGAPAVGRVQWTLSKGMTNGSSTIIPTSIVTELDDTGTVTQDLTSNLDEGTSPPDSEWRVDLRLDNIQPLTYFIQVPPDDTVDLGALLPSDGNTVPVDVVPIWQSFLDIDMDVKPYLQITPGNTKYDKALQDITASVTEQIQVYLGMPVPPTMFFRRFEGNAGWQGSYIQLPYFPVLGTPTVTEYWLSGAHPLTEHTPTSVNANVSDQFTLDRLTGLLARVSGPGLIRPFFPGQGSRNVEVRWTAGYNPVPQSIRTAALEWCNDWYRATQEAVRAGRSSMEYGGPESGQFYKMMPNHVMQALQPYLHVGIA